MAFILIENEGAVICKTNPKPIEKGSRTIGKLNISPKQSDKILTNHIFRHYELNDLPHSAKELRENKQKRKHRETREEISCNLQTFSYRAGFTIILFTSCLSSVFYCFWSVNCQNQGI